jgi:hypothetical protein
MSAIHQKVQLKIDTHGNVTVVDVLGAGQGCQELTSGLEAAFGVVDEKSREITAAAYEDIDPIMLRQSVD